MFTKLILYYNNKKIIIIQFTKSLHQQLIFKALVITIISNNYLLILFKRVKIQVNTTSPNTKLSTILIPRL